MLLTGGVGCGPPSALQLQRTATYDAPLSADDPHVLVSSIVVLFAQISLPQLLVCMVHMYISTGNIQFACVHY